MLIFDYVVPIYGYRKEILKRFDAIYENAIYQSRLTNLKSFSQSSGSTPSNERVYQPYYKKKKFQDKKCTLDKSK